MMVLRPINTTFGPKVSPGASNFCVDKARLIDVTEVCLSAELVEEIFLGDSVVKDLEILERSSVVPFSLGIAN